MKNKVWMKVTTDKYELPVAVADTVQELAEMTGTSKKGLYSMFCKKRKNPKKYPGYVEVDIDED